MSLLEKRFLNRDTQNPEHVGAATLPYSDTHTIRDVLDPMLSPSITTEYVELTSTHISEKRCRLDNTVARINSVVVDVIDGTPQYYNRDFIVSEDSPNYVYWGGMTMEQYLAVGDVLRITYETEGVPVGVPGARSEEPVVVPAERIDADFTVTKTVSLLVDATSDVVMVSLPYAVDSKGIEVTIKHVAGDNGVLVVPYTDDTIDGNAELALDVSNVAYTLVCDGVAWYIV